MSEMISQFHEKQVVLGKEARNQEYVKKVDGVAENIFRQNVLNPKTESDKKSQYGRAEYLVNSLGGQGEFRANSVEGLKNVLKDSEKTENQKEIAQERLSILEKGVFIVMRWGGDENLQDLLGKGSAVEIDNILPTPLKGLGERVRKNIISNEVILGKLRDLDDIRENCDLENQIDRQSMFEEVDKTYKELIRTKGLNPDEKEQLQMVKTYLNMEMEELGGDSRVNERGGGVISQTDRRTKRGAYDHRTYGQVEGMEGVVPIPIPGEQLVSLEQVNNEDKAKKWITSTFVKMSENPLFFANWWQQGTADQAISMINEQLGYSMHDDEYARMRDYVYATVSVLGLQTVDRNADANSDSYGQFTPPKNMGGFLHWDNEGKSFKTLLSDPEIKKFYDEISNTAFDYERAIKIVEAFSDGAGYDSQNKYLKSLLENQLFSGRNSKDRDLINKGRVAMAIFEVDFMPEWIRYLNESKKYFALHGEEDDYSNYKKLDWLHSFRRIDEIQNPTRGKYDTFAYSVKLEVEEKNQEGKYVKVTELGYEHPRVLRPWDVAAVAKGSYRDRPGIIWGMEKVLAPFIARRLSTKDGKHWISAHGNNAIDLYSKYGKFMSKVFGGSQGTEFDNLTSLDEILPLAANFWGQPGSENVPGGPSKDREDFGNFLSDLFSLKADAMFYPGYKSNAKKTLNAIEGLDLFSGEMEKKKALEGALGPNANIAHGWVAEVRRLYNIDLLAMDKEGYPKYQRFYDAYLRVFIDTPDIEEARKYYKKALSVTQRKRYGEIASSASNIMNIWLK